MHYPTWKILKTYMVIRETMAAINIKDNTRPAFRRHEVLALKSITQMIRKMMERKTSNAKYMKNKAGIEASTKPVKTTGIILTGVNALYITVAWLNVQKFKKDDLRPAGDFPPV
jgi:hypothetical protein